MNHPHVKNLINLGFLLDQDAANIVEKLNEEEYQKLIEGLLKENKLMISSSLIKNILTSEVRILKEFRVRKLFTIQDYVKIMNDRYNFLQNILIKKLELSNIVSINKCSGGDASIIGLVKHKEERDENYVISLEDPTGEIQVIIPKNLGEKLSLDDAVAVSGRINNKILFADKLLYPDIPLKPVKYSLESIRIAFLSDENKADANYLVYKNRIEDKIKNKTYEITNPCIFEVGNVVILIVLGYDPLDVLKKRYVNIENSDFLIEIPPDILFTDRDVNSNYKGISILSLNKIIDLKTREISDI
jgi:DNA polymerase II small subunit/DNA polymerase delta subunit B